MSPLAAGTNERPITCSGCTTQCGLLARLEGERVTALRGDPDHPLSRGYVCPKGKDAADFIARPDRLLMPLKRVGPRGAGRFVEVDWDEALDEIAGRIETLTGQHGKRSLAYSYGTFRGGDWGIGERFMNRFGSPNSCGQDKICYGPITLAEALTYGMGPTVFTPPVAGLTRCIVVWGMRPSASAPLLWRAIGEARRAGAKLIVIDPQQTREVAQADLWLRPLPGRDLALGLALLKLVIAHGWIDRDFIEAHTLGFAELSGQLAGHALSDLTAACGVEASALEAAAKLIGSAGPTLIHAGNGLCQGGRPALQIGRTVACLVAVTGNLGRAGGHQLGGPPRDLRANGAMLDAQHLPPAARAERLGSEALAWPGAGYAALDEAMARVWHGQHDILSWTATAHEPALWRAIEHGLPYPVKALIVQHHNPLGANPDAARVARALQHERLELLVVHELFMTATARLADFVLPAAHWLEKPYYSYGIAFMGAFGDYVGAGHAVVPPAGEARNDYELFRDLGRRLGQAGDWPDTAEAFYAECAAPTGRSFAVLASAPGGLNFGAAARHPEHADEALPPFGVYGTPSGKVELASSLLADWGQPAVPSLLQTALDRVDGDWPLVLTTGGRRIDGFHQNAQHLPRYRAHHPHPEALLHPDTAADLGIADGAWVEIRTPVGAVRQRARLSKAVARTVVEADRWWYPEGTGEEADPYGVLATNINVCTSDAPADCDPVLGTWLMRGLPCRLRALT